MIERPIHIFSTRVAHVAEDMVKHNSFLSLKRQLREASRLHPAETFDRVTIIVKDGKKMSHLKAFTSALRLKMHVWFGQVPILKWLFKLPSQEAAQLEKSLRNEAQAKARKKYGIPEGLKPVGNISSEMHLLSLDPHVAYYMAHDLFSEEQYQAYQAIKAAVTEKKFHEKMNYGGAYSVERHMQDLKTDEERTAARLQFLKALGEKNPQGLPSELQQLYTVHGKLVEIAGKYMDAELKNRAWVLKNWDKVIEMSRTAIEVSTSTAEEKVKQLAELNDMSSTWKNRLQEELHEKRHLQQERKLLLENLRNGRLFSTQAEQLDKDFGLLLDQETGYFQAKNSGGYFENREEFYASTLFGLYNDSFLLEPHIVDIDISPEWVQDHAVPLWREALDAVKQVSA